MAWYFALSCSIIVIIAGLYKKLNVGLTMLLGAAALGLFMKLPLTAFAQVGRDALINSVTLLLVVSILLLGILGYVLKETGSLDNLISSINTLITDLRLITAVMPAIISMLTVPGGAVLSAPLCAEAADKLQLTPARQAVINIWFRHVLYFMLPLFPSLILAAELSGVGIALFVLHNLPLTIVGLAAGFFILFRGVPRQRGGISFSRAALLSFFRSIFPFLIILFPVVVFNIYLPLALLAGIVLALLNYLPPAGKTKALFHRLRTMILPGIKIQVAMVIIGIMVYKEMLTYTGVISDLTNQVIALGVPLIFLIAVAPFLVGVLTGDNSASVAILFPLFIPMLPQTGAAFAAYVAFLYASSTLGHIVSPAHPCFSLTKEYFDAEIKSVIFISLPLLVIVMATAILITLPFGYY